MTRPYRGGALPPPPDLPSEPGAILLVRLSARGDVVLTTPLVEGIRDRWPEAHLSYLVEAPAAPLIRHHPAPDEVIVWDRTEWKRLLGRGRWRALTGQLRALRRRLRARSYDLAIDLQGRLRSALVTRLSGAPIRIGLGPREGGGLFMTHHVPGSTDIDTLGGDYRDLGRWLGVDVSRWRPSLTLAPADHAAARARLGEAGIEGAYALIVPHTTRPQKHWREVRWGSLIDRIGRRTGWPVVMVGGPADRAAADRIIEASSGRGPVDLVGRTSLGEAAALVAEASLVVGVDTALTHLAHAFERRTVCLFGPSAYTLPPTPQARIIRHDELACVRCMPRGGTPSCGGAWWCMERITEAEVMSHVDDLLAGRDDPRPPART